MVSIAREQFAHQLEVLDGDLQNLGQQVVAALSHALDALQRNDLTGAKWVIDDDAKINEAWHVFDEQVMVLIATQQPVATNLRWLLAVLDIADELERIGDYAKGIARAVVRNAEQPSVPLPATLMQMGERAQSMLSEVLQVVKRRDADAARQIAATDDQIDAMNKQVQSELMSALRSNTDAAEHAVELLRVAYNLERVGDRTTNIAERVVFMVSGQSVELNT